MGDAKILTADADNEKNKRKKGGVRGGEEGGGRENGQARAVCGDNEQNVDSTTLVKPDI